MLSTLNLYMALLSKYCYRRKYACRHYVHYFLYRLLEIKEGQSNYAAEKITSVFDNRSHILCYFSSVYCGSLEK